MAAFRKTARKAINTLLGQAGFQLVRPGENAHVMSFQPLKRTLNEAAKAGLSVGEYIDKKFHVPGATQSTIDKLVALGALNKNLQHVCEIGPGSGRYLEKVQNLCSPHSHEIYETDQDWCDWLARTYRVKACPADGTSLMATATGSMDLVHAHKVFVYLQFVVACSYFAEMIRVARSGGWIVFDMVSENCMPDATIEKWIAGKIYYPCIMPRSFVIEYFGRRNSFLQESFFAPMLPGKSEYFVFRKDRAQSHS